MAKFNLFKKLTLGIKKTFENVINAFTGKEEKTERPLSEVTRYVEEKQKEWNKPKVKELKEKYNSLFNLANTKYNAINDLGLGEHSIAFQNAGRSFNIDEIETTEELFREVARAQTFINEPTSNIEVIKKYIEDAGIDLYVGRGNGEDDMKSFWEAVNKAKETSNIKNAIELKRYSGAFEYAYKVWQEDKSEVGIKRAIDKFLEEEYSVYSTNIMTDNALKYERPAEADEDGFYM